MLRRLSVWVPLPPSVHLRRPSSQLPFPLDEDDCGVVAWARHGIFHGVQHLALGRGDVVLVPAYHHGSEIQALVEAGLDVRYYDAAPDLEPDPEELEAQLDGSVRALYITHVMGIPIDAERWRAWCDERGLLLIEDAAQAWLAERDGVPVGSFGDLAVFCLYKTVGLGEGAAVRCRIPVDQVPTDPRWGVAALLRQHGRWLVGRSGAADVASQPFRSRRPHDPARDFALRDPWTGPWGYTEYVLRRMPHAEVAERRRANYRWLLERLGDRVPAPFADPPAGSCPFALPLTVDPAAMADASRELDRAGIGHMHFWSTPHPTLDVAGFPRAAARRASTLALPVHQELRPEDLDAIAVAATRSPVR